MKDNMTQKHWLISLFFLFLFLSCSKDGDQVYRNLAKDLCACVNDKSLGLKPQAEEGFIRFSSSGGDLEEEMKKIFPQDSMMALRQVKILEKLPENWTYCVDEVSKNYVDVYAAEDQKKAAELLISAIKKDSSCSLCYALISVGNR